MIKINNLNKKFGEHDIFGNLCVSVKKGEKIALVGESGSGKSTLINIMAGLDTDYSGEVEVAGYKNPKLGKTNTEFYDKEISLILQDYGLINEKSIKDNFKIIKNRKTDKEMEEVLKKVGLEKQLGDKVYTLSGGEKQRVAIARNLLKNSAIWFCDEPTGNLDDKTSGKIEELLLSLDKTLIIVTHDLEFASRCDRCIELKKKPH